MFKKISYLVFITFLLISCNNSVKDKNSIKIGAVLPLTGDIAEYGQRVKKGIDLAIQEINSQNTSVSIDVIYEDSEGKPNKGLFAAQKLLSDGKVEIIIGAVSSTVTLAIEPLTTKKKVILFSPAASNPKLTGISPYFLRNWPSDVLEAKVLSDYAYKSLNISSVSILYVNNDYGIGLMNEFKQNFESLGGKVKAIETYNQAEVDFRSQLSNIKLNEPDAIYLAGYHKEMANATIQIFELGIDSQILGDADYGVQELLEITGNSSEGAIFVIPETDDNNSTALKFKNAFKDKYNSEPSIFEANGYDCIKLIFDALQSGCDNNSDIVDLINNLKNYGGAFGKLTFSEGDVIKPISIMKVQDNSFVKIK